MSETVALAVADSVDEAEHRTRGYLLKIEAERASMGEGIGASPLDAAVLPGATRYVGKV